jgi:glyoxylase-like metal-dependent hydrolase (beta-lactamase superfamily II)
MIRKTFAVGPLSCNCSIIGDEVSGKALLIDPGGDPDRIINELESLQLKVCAIIHTHAHLDHFLASGVLKEKLGVPLYLHFDDKFLWDAVDMQCQMLGIEAVKIPPPDRFLKDDQALELGGIALHTPGHSPGSMCFWFESHNLLVAGDTLFHRSVGRTDLPGGSAEAIKKSIKDRIYQLPPSATVVTGHGPDTRIGDEMNENLFVRN